MYEKTTARVVVGEGASEEFEVKIGLRQGSVLSPLLFLTRAEDKPKEDGSAAHRPPEGRAGRRAGGEETDSGEQFRVHRRDSVRRRVDGERRAQAGNERVDSS